MRSSRGIIKESPSEAVSSKFHHNKEESSRERIVTRGAAEGEKERSRFVDFNGELGGVVEDPIDKRGVTEGEEETSGVVEGERKPSRRGRKRMTRASWAV
ncbi:hypothetical protein Bca4012_063191 [Brassica carinata]